MKFNYFSVLGLFSIFISLNSNAAYQYTYTGTPFTSIDSEIKGDGYGLTKISSDDFLTIMIKSNDLLTTTTKFISDASVEFSVGSYYKIAKWTDYTGPVIKDVDLRIPSFDENGLPETWSLAYDEFTNAGLHQDFEIFKGISFRSYSGGGFAHDYFGTTIFSSLSTTNYFNVYAESTALGQWQLSEIAGPISPVPEAPLSTMFLSGLGMLAYLRNRNKHKT